MFFYATVCKKCFSCIHNSELYVDIHFSSEDESKVSDWLKKQLSYGHEFIHRAAVKYKEDLPTRSLS